MNDRKIWVYEDLSDLHNRLGTIMERASTLAHDLPPSLMERLEDIEQAIDDALDTFPTQQD